MTRRKRHGGRAEISPRLLSNWLHQRPGAARSALELAERSARQARMQVKRAKRARRRGRR